MATTKPPVEPATTEPGVEPPAEPTGQDSTTTPPADNAKPPPRCDTRDEDNRRCLYEVHSDSFPHLFTPPISADAAPEIEAARRNAGTKVRVRRTAVNAWWCGKCDNSQQPNDNRVCHACGAIPQFNA